MGTHVSLSKGNQKYWIDFAERVGFTAAYAVVSEAIVEISDLKQAWVPIIMIGLNAIKSLIAKQLNGTGGAITPAPAPAQPPVGDPQTSGAEKTL